MSETEGEDIEYELVLNVGQLGPPPELRREMVVLSSWKTASGKAAAFWAYELSAADYGAFVETGRVYKDGVFKRYDSASEDVRFLAFTLCDASGNRLWNTVEAAKVQLGRLGKGELNLLLAAANRVNTAREAATEGNSEETLSGS